MQDDEHVIRLKVSIPASHVSVIGLQCNDDKRADIVCDDPLLRLLTLCHVAYCDRHRDYQLHQTKEKDQ